MPATLLSQLRFLASSLACSLVCSALPGVLNAQSSQPIFNGVELDYMPDLIRVEPGRKILIAFERVNPSTFAGDLYVSSSSDEGVTWTKPSVAIATARNERHPALVQLGPSSFALFYLVDTSGFGNYRIYRATSSDGLRWTERGAIDLGWLSTGEINPDVIVEADGSLTMAYQRLSDAVYVARSSDGGATWDKRRTRVSAGLAALPRIAKRASDGKYLVTYQTGSRTAQIWSKASRNVYQWPSTRSSVSTNGNSHDATPIVLEGGSFLATYAHVTGTVFNVEYRTSFDGQSWSPPTSVTTDSSLYNVQPHPMRHGTPGRVVLAWSRQESALPFQDHDVWFERDLRIPLPLWIDKERFSASAGGAIRFALDASAQRGNRAYVLLGSITGTTPGIRLPGGLATLPVNWDGFGSLVLAALNTSAFSQFAGSLDASGKANAQFRLGPMPTALVGREFHFAYALAGPWDFVSNPVGIAITR